VELRERILQKLRLSSTAGLGDEAHGGDAGGELSPTTVWTGAHLEMLHEVRDAVRARKT
jgi:hypothetical protein